MFFRIKILGTVSRALASEYRTRRWPRRAFRRGLPYGVFSLYIRWDTWLAYTVVYPIPPASQHDQPSIPNAEGNLRNQPVISMRRSTAKIEDRYNQEGPVQTRQAGRPDGNHAGNVASCLGCLSKSLSIERAGPTESGFSLNLHQSRYA